MEPNEFSLDALLSCSDFKPEESMKTSDKFDEFEEFAEENVKDEKILFNIKTLAENYGCSSYNDGFKQGFCFAVKSIKFLLKI